MAASISLDIKETSYNVNNNSSNVSVAVVAKWTNGSWNHMNTTITLTADGKKYTHTGTYLFNPNRTTSGSSVMHTFTFTVPHNADGTKTLSVSATYSWNGISATGSLKLTDIPRAAKITNAQNFNDEDNPTITYSNPAGSAVNLLQACISLDGSKADIPYRNISKTGSSYTFTLTETERKTLRQAASNSNSINVRFYIATTIGDEVYRVYVTKTLSIVNAKPTLNPSVVDKGSVSVTLTGDANNKIIKGYNSMSVAANATAKKEATIKSYKITCGGKSITTASGSLGYVESGSFVFTVTDSRGNTTTQTVSKSLINYVDLTCNLHTSPPTPNGHMTFTIKGNYFNGSFGAVNNSLQLQYRYKENNGNYIDWVTLTPTISGNTYTYNGELTGLNYQSNYTFQARALDKIYNGDTEPVVETKAQKLKTAPVFDWSETDFNFNVPVTMNYNNYEYNLLGLFRAMTTTYTPECEVTPGDNYSSATVTAHLTGCNLRIGLSATRNASLAAGNFSNETVCTVDVNHGGKLANLYRVSFNTSTSGGVATLDCQASKISDDVVRLTINLCAAAQALTDFNAYFAMPCTIVTKAYV